MKKLLTIVLAAAAMVACTNDELVSINAGDAITFDNAFIDNATRTAIDGTYTINTLDEFQVYATITNAANSTANIFAGERVVKGNSLGQGTNWSYDSANTQYWVAGNTYDFRAIADGNVTDVTEATTDANGLLSGVTLKDVTAQKDLLLAEQMGVTYTSGPQTVKFTFNHLLAKVKFTFKNTITTNNGYSYKVTDIKINDTAKEGVYTIGTGWAVDAAGAKADLAFGNGVATSSESGADATAIAYGGSVESNWERLLIPSKEARNITFSYQLLKGDVVIDSQDKEITTNAIDLKAGYSYNFIVALGNPGEAILFDVEKVNDWDTTPSDDYSYDISTGAVVVNTAEGLQTVVAAMNEGNLPNDVDIVLGGDIDLAELAAQTRAEVDSNWEPIGRGDQTFDGVFDGNNYAIRNLKYTSVGEDYFVGLFGCLNNATIKNLTLTNVDINLSGEGTWGHIGAVAGWAQGKTSFENITINGTVKIVGETSETGSSRIGAVVGGNQGGDITMKNVVVNVNPESYVKGNSHVGGIAGQLQGKATLENCSSNINVECTMYFVGGIIGCAPESTVITNCHTTGNVTLTAGSGDNSPYRIGGIAGGWADSATGVLPLDNCSFAGKLTSGEIENFDYWGYVGRGYGLKNCEGSKVIIDGVEFVQVGNTAPYGNYTINGMPVATVAYVENADEFATALENGKNIFVLKDFAVENSFAVKKDQTVTIDLNGKTISGTDNATGNFGLITSNGNLTIKGGGKMTLVANNNRNWNAYSSVLSNNPGGNLTVEGGVVIEHLGGTDMAYGIDNLTNGKGTKAVTTVKDATIKSSYRAIRQFLNGVEAYNELYVEAGAVIEGASRSIWMQDANANANPGKLIVAEGAELNGDVLLSVTAGSTEWPVEVSIAASAVNGEVLTGSAPVPAGKAVRLVDGYYTVVDVTVVESNEALKDAVAAGGTLVLADGNYTMPSVGSDVTISGTTDTVITVSGTPAGDNVTFEGVTVKGSGYATGVNTKTATYNKATIEGTMCLYQEKVVFNECTFNLHGDYIWTYGVAEVEFINCTFNCDNSKAILIYNEGDGATKATVKGCTFIAAADGKAGTISNQNCAAIEIDNFQSSGVGTAHQLITEGNNYNDYFSGEWRIKRFQGTNPIKVNGVEYTKTALDGKLMTVTGGVATMD